MENVKNITNFTTIDLQIDEVMNVISTTPTHNNNDDL
jgi:hypothetical protein